MWTMKTIELQVIVGPRIVGVEFLTWNNLVE